MSANRLKLNTNKTELLWAGTNNCLSLYDGSFPCLQLGADTVLPGQHVRVLGVVISSDLSLEKHVSRVSASSFHYLRQLRRIRRSLNSDSVATLIHAFAGGAKGHDKQVAACVECSGSRGHRYKKV